MAVTLSIEGYGALDVEEGATLLEACEDHDVPMDAACGGFAACSSCRVEVLSGMEHLSERLEEEEGFVEHDRQRLGCQARVLGPVAIRLDPGM